MMKLKGKMAEKKLGTKMGTVFKGKRVK